MSRGELDPSTFASPGTDYRGVALWMLNDELDAQELARQLRGMRDAGWGAVIDRTFNGLRTPYLSPAWHGLVNSTIAGARGLGMRVWLQAGYMPGGVPDLEPKHEHRVLVRKRAAEASAETETLLLEGEGFHYYERRVPYVLDLLNREACAAYVRKAYTEPLEANYGRALGGDVETIWVDEPHFRPPLLPWTPALPDVFRARWGYDLVRELPSLYEEVGDYRKVRHHFWRCVLELVLGAYFAEIADWCSSHRVAFSGHLMGEDTLQAQVSWTGACMPCYQYMGLPGIDHLTRSLSWPAEKAFIMTPKQCSSAANQLGKQRKLAEMYGVSSQGITFEDRKRIGDWMMTLGINYRCYHGAFYSLRGRRKRIYAPHLSYQQPWWRENRYIADYFSRLSYVMQQGTYEADILVLHPVESAFCLYDSSEVQNVHDMVREHPAVRRYTEGLIDLSANLLRVHRGFEYGDETLMASHAHVEGTELVVGRMRYRAVLLPSLLTIRASTVKLLAAFLDAGGIVLSAGDLPSRVEGVENMEISALTSRFRPVANDGTSLAAELDVLLPADLRIEPRGRGDVGSICLHSRRAGDQRLIFVTNPGETETVAFTLRIRGSGRLERWDLVRGTVEAMGAGRDGEWLDVELELPPAGSELLALSPGEPLLRSRDGQTSRSVPVQGPLTVRRLDPNVLPLDFCRYRRGREGWSERVPVVAVQETLTEGKYNGPVTLEFAFRIDEIPPRLHVVVEDAEEYEIEVNGARVHPGGLPYYVDRSFHPVDATAALRKGENVVEITREFLTPSEPKFGLGSLFHTATGVELESIYVVGDFAVRGSLSRGQQEQRCVRYAPSFTLVRENPESVGDLLAEGYPFYAGRIRLSSAPVLEKPKAGERAVLVLPSLGATVATVRVGGREAGKIAWPPHELDVSAAIGSGARGVEVELATSLRNLLGPHHRPTGEPDQVWADGWTGKSSPGRRDTALRSGAEWWKRRDTPEVFWTDDYFLVPLGIDGGMRVEYRAARHG